MEHWPADERHNKTQDREQSKAKGKEKTHVQDDFWRWPHLEHGSIGRATLISKEGQLQFSTVVDTSRRRTLIPLGKPARIFPETRPPQVNVREHSTRKRSEQGLQYLRTYFPDADFPADLVGGELASEAKDTRDLEAFDPFSGNLLGVLPSHHTQDGYIAAFPMGEPGRELNLSPLDPSGSENIIFNPSGVPSFTFETPIQQISSAVTPSQWTVNPFSFLMARTYTSASLLQVVAQKGESSFKVTRELDITKSDTGDVPILDARILAAGPDIIAVNRDGGVYRCNTYQGGKAMQLIRGGRTASPTEDGNEDNFWQLGMTDRDDGCFLASSKVVEHFDFRSSNATSDVFSIDRSNAVVTSFECPKHDYVSRVTTTSDVIWLDDRFRQKPLMSFKHHRSYDRTLRTVTAQLASGPLSLLMSRKNGLVTVYDVNRGTDGLIHCNSTPACLPCDGTTRTSYTGYAAIVLPSGSNFSLLRLGQRGNILRQDIRVFGTGEDQSQDVTEDSTTHGWSNDVLKLEKQANELQPDFGPAGARHYTVVDLRGAYEKIFAIEDNEEVFAEETFSEMLDRLPDFWHQTEAPVENMLTTFDVAFRAGEEPKLPSRADFLTCGTINSRRGFSALMHGELPLQDLASHASWDYNIHNTSTPFYDHSDDWPALHERLKELDLVSDTDRAGPSVRRETEARDQLVLDLALSSNVYSAQPFTKPHSSTAEVATFDTTSQPAKDIYPSDEPPEVKFGYLRPVHKIGGDHYSGKDKGVDQDTAVSSSLGVRLLLAEWEVGTDPGEYTYLDPYGVTEEDHVPALPRRRLALPGPPPLTQRTQVASQRPPMVVAAATTGPPPVQSVLWAPVVTQAQIMQRTHSQQTVFNSSPDLFSQEPMTSTQVLPGPFGGRQVVGAKKKPAKKRIAHKTRALSTVWQVLILDVPNARNWDLSGEERGSMDGTSSRPINPWFDRAALNDTLKRNKSVVCALSASYISTLAGYPLDSLKSRLQTTKTRISVPKLAGLVYREEGVIGFYRGLWIPLMTISFVRAASFTIYSDTKEYCRKNNYFSQNKMSDAAFAGGISGALSGSLISFGSAPFELVKVRRQLEYSIAATKGVQLVKPPNTLDAVREIFRRNGLSGLYIGFRLHFLRDTAGTALYFFEYDAMRHLLGRQRSGEQGPTPPWLPIPVSLIPFVCGSLAGVTSWALIYPLDVVKTKIQQRALAGTPPRGVFETLRRLVRGPDPKDPKPVLAGVARIYRGLGVSAVRSITTHGLLWTFFDITSHYIDHLP
ncbi:hypothetical protein HYDPIDRAFT_184954 [Hydnomerulius pinastri MD-312]|nr:hypothetical protein HYDPIDRAFT_184954 [Hydnomerulius pinastri MD-312]